MNKTEVINGISEKTGIDTSICSAVMNALEDVSGNILLARMKGVKLCEESAVTEISEKSGVCKEDCTTILTAFEETFSEALSHKFRFFKKKK